MKLDCEIIRDLLPLYGDNVCSEKSREAVEEHLRECETCREELKALGENNIPALLRAEGGTPVIGAYRRMLKNIRFFLLNRFSSAGRTSSIGSPDRIPRSPTSDSHSGRFRLYWK